MEAQIVVEKKEIDKKNIYSQYKSILILKLKNILKVLPLLTIFQGAWETGSKRLMKNQKQNV